MIRILIVDDQSFTRKAVQAILEQEEDFCVIGQAANGVEAISFIEQNSPDIALVDLEMPEMNGFSLTHHATKNFPKTKVVILSACDDKDSIDTAIKAGAKGFLLKNTSGQEIVDTIRYVQRGYFQLGPGLLENIIAGLNPAEPLSNEKLNQVESRAQESFIRLQTEIEHKNQLVRRELFHELEMQINHLKQDFRFGLDTFQQRVSERMNQGFSSLGDRFGGSYSTDVDLRRWEEHLNARELQHQQQVNRILTGTKKSMLDLEKRVKFLTYCLIFLAATFFAEKIALLIF